MVNLRSAPGRGTTFELWWPVGLGAPSRSRLPPPAEARRGAGESILIAEDDPLVRASLAELLESAGYRVRAAEDGLQALELFRRHGAALVILDAVMPGASGLQTFRQLEVLAPEVPVLFTSGYASSVFPEEENVVVPLSIGLAMWLFVGFDYSVPVLRLLLTLLFMIFLGYALGRVRLADVSGVLSGILMGFLIVSFTDFRWFVLILSFFVIGGIFTK